MRSSTLRKPRLRRPSTALAALLLLGAAGCAGDGPTESPADAPDAPDARSVALVVEPITVPLLARATPLHRDVTYQVAVSGYGGVIRIPEAGLHINVPAGAVPGKKPIRFTVTAVAGNAVAYRFGPHGLKFTKPLLAIQDLSVTNFEPQSGVTLEAGYFASDADLDTRGKAARISEVFPTALATGNRVRWQIPHFSGYVIATGRGTR